MAQYYEARLDQIFSALGDPTRRRMLAALMRGEASVSELAAPHDISLAGAAKHVRVLAAAGLVSHEKRGRVRTCRLNPAAMQQAAGWLAQYEKFWTGKLDALDEFLRETEET